MINNEFIGEFYFRFSMVLSEPFSCLHWLCRSLLYILLHIDLAMALAAISTCGVTKGSTHPNYVIVHFL